MRQKTTSGKPRKSRFHGLHNHPFVVPVLTFLVLFFVSLFGYISFNGQTIGASDSRVVSVSIDGQEQIVPTRAQDVADLLKRLNITLGEKDIVNPALDTPIEENNFQVNIYRARPVLVEDGSSKTVTYTAQPTPEAIVEAAGVQVYPEDRLKTAGANNVEARDLLREGIIAERVIIDRATLASLNLYGTQVEVRTHASTVADLLIEKNVKLNEGDTLQLGCHKGLGWPV